MHDTQPFTRSSSHTHMVIVGGGRKGLGRLEPSTTGSKPEPNLLNLNLGVCFKVQQTAELNLFCGYRFRSKVAKPALNQTMDSLVKSLRQSKNNINSL